MKGYWLILGTEVSNQEAQAKYGRLWKPIAEKYQARINPLGTPPALKEARDAHRGDRGGIPLLRGCRGMLRRSGLRGGEVLGAQGFEPRTSGSQR